MSRFRLVVAAAAVVASVSTTVHNQGTIRSASFALTEVTQPELTVSPDGTSLVFTALGHLFLVPTTGGTATQLTFGAAYDSDPQFSPDGTRLAFVSDRDGSGGNVFALDVTTRRVTQLTRESQAELPAWGPGGTTIAYARVRPREEAAPRAGLGTGEPGPREIRTIPSAGGMATVVGTPQNVGALFYLEDGRLVWTVPERPAGGGMFAVTKQTRLETRNADGTVAQVATIGGDAGRLIPQPSGNGLLFSAAGNIRLLPLGRGQQPPTVVVALGGGAGRFSIPRAGDAVYFSRGAQIFRVVTSGGTPEALKLAVPVKLDYRPPVAPKWTAATKAGPPQAVVTPLLSPDGTRVVFMAAGFLWEQPVSGGQARRLTRSAAFERDPSFSPDGSTLAFAASEAGRRQLKVYDFQTRQTRTLLSMGGASWALFPNWKRDGSAIVVQRSDTIGAPYRLLNITVADGKVEELAQTRTDWASRPHFSSDGSAIYYTARTAAGANGVFYRLALRPDAKPEAVTELTRHVHEGLVSPDGNWFALRRNSEIWVAPMPAGRTIKDADLRRFSEEGGRSFSFTSDSSSIVYSGGGRVWRQPLRQGARVEIPIRLTLPRAVAPTTVLRRVRVADLQTGRLSDETSLVIEGGRIRAIGAERGVPAGATVVDAGGRIAIPGLFDLHVHAGWASQQANADTFIAFGITSVRDTGGTLDILAALDDRTEATSAPVPRYFFSGEIFEGTAPQWGDAFLQIATEAEAREHVRRWKAWGVDFIKVYPSLPWQLQHVVNDEAHRLGVPLVGHGIGADEIIRRSVQGYASLEHSPAVLNDDLIKVLAATGTRLDATLTIWGGHTLLMRDEPERLTAGRVLTFVPEEIIKSAPTGGLMGRQQTDTIRAGWKDRLARIKIAQQSGVKLRAGTDSLMSGTMFGLSLHWELEHYVQAGFSPLEALRLATVDAAEAVGASADLGTIAPGKLADLVVLDANPIDDIKNTQKIWRVVKGGHVFDPSTFRAPK